jgi:hypothetical protein
MRAAVLPLQPGSSWDPETLVPEPRTAAWPETYSGAYVPLRSLVEVVEAQARTATGDPLVTPRDVSPRTGRPATTTAATSDRCYEGGLDLQPGDLLIAARTPAFLVLERDRGQRFSPQFTAVRPLSRPAALWAVLASATGAAALDSAYRAGGHGTRETARDRGSPLDVLIPVDLVASVDLLAVASEASRYAELQPQPATPGSWWRTVALPADRWDIMIAHPEPEQILSGITLDSLCSRVVPGRHVDPETLVDRPRPRYAPLWTTRSLQASAEPDRWVPETGPYTWADPGTLVMTAIGPKWNATVSTTRAVIGSSLLGIDFLDPEHAGAVAAWIRMQAAPALSLLAKGTTMPRLSPSDLRKLRVPSAVLRASGQVAPVDLSTRLEELTWALA